MQKKKFNLKKFLLIFSLAISILFALFGLTIGIIYNKYSLDINKLTSINNGVRVYSMTNTDNNLYNTNRSIVEIETLPDYVLNAFIDTEDKRFYSHNGYDFKRIVKAGIVNLARKSKSQGASTISQQLIKNTILNSEKTYKRKLKEVVLASKMEKKFSKKEILEMYLNTIYFGSNAYGIENASKTYFNKSASELTINEACCLAGMIKSPNNYSPRTNMNNCIERKNLVAKNMLDAGHISKEEYKTVVNSSIELKTNMNLDHSYEEEAIFEACKLLNISERELINNNYQIITFKDDELQKEVVKANNEVINTAKTTNDTALDSMSIVANNEGQIKAYYVNSPYNLHNMKRQPASTLKPLAVYLPCIIHNLLTPATQLLDEQIDYNGFSPKNADGKFHGYISTREALSKSLNIPAVKALDYLGIVKAKETLNDFNINLTKNDFNLTLALGAVSNGVSHKDLLAGYLCLANMGEYKSLSFVSQILDGNGNIVYSHDNFSQKLFNDADCFLVNDMLKDSVLTGSAKRLGSLNLPIASKTGTAFDGTNKTDLYNVAYTTEHSVISWVANIKENKLPSNMYSSVEPTEINKRIFDKMYKNHKPNDFSVPDGIEKLPYDLVEANENHRIVAPTTQLDRYIAYDYFKKENPPIKHELEDDVNFNVNLDRTGASISFSAKKSNEYTVYKKLENEMKEIGTFVDRFGFVETKDKDIFKQDEIVYSLKINDGIYKEIKIRPKDYLITILNNEILSGKRKWYV